MNTKGEKTKTSIIQKSTMIFAKKGYSLVTMKDICETCGMSRGGLYRHFSSTREIFIEMLDKDIVTNRQAMEESIKNNTPAKAILDYYFDGELNSITSENRGIYFAIHEFAFLETDQRQYFKNRLKDSIEILSVLFEYGQKTGEFKEFDVISVATHILYMFDSLKTTCPIFDPSEETIKLQIKILKELVI